MDTQRRASVQRPLRFTPDENSELTAFLSGSGQGYQSWAHDTLLALARSGFEVGSEPPLAPPAPRPQRPARAIPLPPPPPQSRATREPSTGWTPPPGGWSR